MSEKLESLKLGYLVDQGKILIKAIEIIEALSNQSLADQDGDCESEDMTKMKNLIIMSRTLVNDPCWELLIKAR
jgi:hypothetical protein